MSSAKTVFEIPGMVRHIMGSVDDGTTNPRDVKNLNGVNTIIHREGAQLLHSHKIFAAAAFAKGVKFYGEQKDYSSIVNSMNKYRDMPEEQENILAEVYEIAGTSLLVYEGFADVVIRIMLAHPRNVKIQMFATRILLRKIEAIPVLHADEVPAICHAIQTHYLHADFVHVATLCLYRIIAYFRVAINRHNAQENTYHSLHSFVVAMSSPVCVQAVSCVVLCLQQYDNIQNVHPDAQLGGKIICRRSCQILVNILGTNVLENGCMDDLNVTILSVLHRNTLPVCTAIVCTELQNAVRHIARDSEIVLQLLLQNRKFHSTTNLVQVMRELILQGRPNFINMLTLYCSSAQRRSDVGADTELQTYIIGELQRDNDLGQMQSTLQLLVAMCKGHRVNQEFLIRSGGLGHLRNILSRGALNPEIKLLCLMVLQTIFEQHNEQTERFSGSSFY